MADMKLVFLETRDATTVDRLGNVQAVKRTSFLVGDQGPFVVQVPNAEFTAARVRQEAEKVANEIRGLAPDAG